MQPLRHHRAVRLCPPQRRRAWLALPWVLIACSAPFEDETAGDAPPGSDFEGPAFELEEVVDGVFHARGAGALAVGSNGAVVVGNDGVLLVESHISPAAAHALMQEISAVTDLPVRFVVNTHFHFDHAHGNAAYPPDVRVIGHEFTREAIASGASMTGSYENFLAPLPDQIEAARIQVSTESDSAAREEARARLRYLRNYLAGQEGLRPVPPNTTLSERMTLFAGGREIRLLFLGRGHTGGDVVVFLPEERVAITGDLLVEGIPFMGDGFIPEWIDALEALKELDIEWVLPGHGRPFRGKERIGRLQAYLSDLYEQTARLRREGASPEEAARMVNLSRHREHFPQILDAGAPLSAVRRIFEQLEAGSTIDIRVPEIPEGA